MRKPPCGRGRARFSPPRPPWGDGSAQSVYSIHKSATIDLLNGHFRPYQNEIYPEESAIVELVPEGEYLARDYDDTQENLNDISKGDSNDGAQ